MSCFQSQVDETAERTFCHQSHIFFLACKVMAEASPTMGLIDKRDPVARYPGTHPPCAVAGSCGPWSAIIPTRKRSRVHSLTSFAHFLQFTLTERLDCPPSNRPSRSCGIVSGSVQLNTNATAAISLDNGQAVLVRIGHCPVPGCGFRGLFTHGY